MKRAEDKRPATAPVGDFEALHRHIEAKKSSLPSMHGKTLVNKHRWGHGKYTQNPFLAGPPLLPHLESTVPKPRPSTSGNRKAPGSKYASIANTIAQKRRTGAQPVTAETSKGGTRAKSALRTRAPVVPSQTATLEEALASVSAWTDSAEKEEEFFNSFTLFAQMKLNEVLKTTEKYGMPNAPRAAVCLELLAKLGQCFGRYSALHSRLVHEVLQMVYYKFDTIFGDHSGNKPITRQNLLEATPFFSKVNGLESSLYVAQMKADRMKKLFADTSSQSEKRSRVVDRAIASWSHKLLARLFQNWRSQVVSTRHKLRVLKRRQMQLLFNKWREARSKRAFTNMDDTIESLTREVATWEEAAHTYRARNEMLEEENAMLRTQLKAALDSDASGKSAQIKFNKMVNKMKKEIHVCTEAMDHLVQHCLKDISTTVARSYDEEETPYWMNMNDLRPVLRSLEIHEREKGGKRHGFTLPDVPQTEMVELGCDTKILNAATESLASYLSMTPLEQIKTWINHTTAPYKIGQVENLSSSLRDSKELTVLVQAALTPNRAAGAIISLDGDDGVQLTETELDGNLEDDLDWTPDMFFARVMHELDDHDRARLFVKGTRAILGTPESVIHPEEISLTPDANSNYAFCSSVYNTTPGLGADSSFFDKDLDAAEALRTEWEDALVEHEMSETNEDEKDAPSFADKAYGIVKAVTTAHHTFRSKLDGLTIGHLMWGASVAATMTFGYEELSKQARGLEGSVGAAEEQSEKAEYTRLEKHKIMDILKHDDNPDEEIKHLQSFLGEVFIDMRKIYKAYASMGAGGGSTISIGEFNKLMTDCKVCDNVFTQTDIDLIFVRANWEIDEEGNKIDSKNNPDRAMTSSEFVEGLIRVAHGKFNSSMGGTVLTMCLRKLVYQHILPFARRSDAEAFRKVLAGPGVQRVFKKHNKSLKDLFTKRAGLDKSMSMMEYAKLLRDTNTIDGKTFSQRNVAEIFNCVQDDGSASDDTTMMESELDFAEFIESVAAVGAIKYPDPYTDIAQRIEKYLLMFLLSDPKKSQKRGKGANKSTT